MSQVRLGLLACFLWCSILSFAQAQAVPVGYWQGEAYSPETYTNMLWHTDGMCVSLRQQVGLPRFSGPASRARREYNTWKARTGWPASLTINVAPSPPPPSEPVKPTQEAYRIELRAVEEQEPIYERKCIGGVCQWVQTGTRTKTVQKWVKVRIPPEPTKAEVSEEKEADLEEGDTHSTPWPVVKRMVKEAHAGYGKKVFDLGCRDGRFLVEAAKQGAEVIGVELDPKWAKAARQNLKEEALPGIVVEGDMYDCDPSSADVVFLYHHEDVLERLVAGLPPGTVVASYAHEPPGIDATRYTEAGHEFYIGVVPKPTETLSEPPTESILEEEKPRSFIIPQRVYGLSR